MKRRPHCSDDDWGVPRCMHSARMKGPLGCVELGARACCGSPEPRAPRTSVHGQTTSVEQGASGGSTSEQRQGTRRFAICTPASLPMQSCVSGRRMPVLACKNRVLDASINRARRPACQRADAEQASEQLQAPARLSDCQLGRSLFFLSFFCFATGQLGDARKSKSESPPAWQRRHRCRSPHLWHADLHAILQRCR